MVLMSLELENFRNYDQTVIHFNKERNVICGKNAQGKSNLLEAIFLLCISRSFRTNYEQELLKFDQDHYLIKGEFLLDSGNKKTVIFHYQNRQRKQVSINRKKISKLSEYIGQFPVVLSSPEEYNLTAGSPNERRKFFDILLSQISIKYIHNLQEYYRILKQRNKILNERNYRLKQHLEPWSEALINIGSRIIWDRFVFQNTFRNIIKEVYSKLNQANEELNFKYISKFEITNLDDLENQFREKLASIEAMEFKKGNTLIGPHRDDYSFYINDKLLRKYGSRGQHKTVLIALMIAEYNLIKEQKNERPIILIDDLFSEIDNLRTEKILDFLKGSGQTFFTTIIESPELKKYIDDNKDTNFYDIEMGNIREN